MSASVIRHTPRMIRLPGISPDARRRFQPPDAIDPLGWQVCLRGLLPESKSASQKL